MRASLALPVLALSLAVLVGAPAALAAGPTAGGAPIFGAPPKGVPNFTGKWLIAKSARKLTTVDGAAPPLNAAGKAEYAKRMAALKRDPATDPVSDCKMQGIPRLMYAPYPMLILQYGNHVDFVHQTNHTFRIVYFDAPKLQDPDPTWLGHPSAHWDGRTLVIDSTVFNDETWLDPTGLPHSDKLKVQERYRLVGPSTIEGRITIDDPTYYAHPWTVGLTLKKQPGFALEPAICEDVHKM